MNNYIIDPSVFYWMNVMSILQTVMAVLGGFTLVGCLCLIVTYICDKHGLHEPKKPDEDSRYEMKHYQDRLDGYNEYLQDVKMIKKYMLITLTVGALFVIISIFIPSKHTSVEMLVAKTATFDNVNWSVQQVKEIVDYIVSALKGAM